MTRKSIWGGVVENLKPSAWFMTAVKIRKGKQNIGMNLEGQNMNKNAVLLLYKVPLTLHLEYHV